MLIVLALCTCLQYKKKGALDMKFISESPESKYVQIFRTRQFHRFKLDCMPFQLVVNGDTMAEDPVSNALIAWMAHNLQVGILKCRNKEPKSHCMETFSSLPV